MRTTHVNAQSQRTLSSPAGPDPSGGDGGGNDYDGSLAAPGSADPSAGAAAQGGGDGVEEPGGGTRTPDNDLDGGGARGSGLGSDGIGAVGHDDDAAAMRYIVGDIRALQLSPYLMYHKLDELNGHRPACGRVLKGRTTRMASAPTHVWVKPCTHPLCVQKRL